jgi:hypothetical protein
MSWDETKQLASTLKFFEFLEEFNGRYATWTGTVQSGADGTQALAAVDDVLRRWRAHVESLRAHSESVISESAVKDMEQIINQTAEDTATLASLKSQAVTREDQADSVNPKVRESPWTNLLGLDRVFRPATRTNIVIAAIVFGALAIGVLAFLIYRVVVNPSPISYPGGGGGGGTEMIGGARATKFGKSR